MTAPGALRRLPYVPFLGALVLTLALGAALRGSTGLRVLGALPTALARAVFPYWWRAQSIRIRVQSTAPDVVWLEDYTEPDSPATLRLLQYRRRLLAEMRARNAPVAWRHFDVPFDPICNSRAPRSLVSRACEVAAARRLAVRRHAGDEFDEWLSRADWIDDPESIRFGLATITGIDDFPSRVPALMSDVRHDIGVAESRFDGRLPQVVVCGVLLATDRADLVALAVEQAAESRRVGGQRR